MTSSVNPQAGIPTLGDAAPVGPRTVHRTVLAPVAGIAIEHEADVQITFGDAPAWGGSPALAAPIQVRHRVWRPGREGFRKLFDASPSCSYYEGNDGAVVEFRGSVEGVPDQLLLTSRPGYEYELAYASVPRVPMYQRAKDRTIYSMALAHRQLGYIVHACGFLLNGGGVLCPGLPSAGKSTIAGLLARVEEPVTLLSDDRIALTGDGDGFRIWGTPWPGDARVIGVGDGPLRAIVLMRHGSGATLRVLGPRVGARRLLETLVLPLWDRTLLPGSLAFVDRLVRSVPMYELTYEPTVAAVSAMLQRLAAGAPHV